MKKILLLFTTIFLEGVIANAQFSPILDPFFGAGGIVIEEFGADAAVEKMTILFDGKILTVAILKDEFVGHSLAIHRYHSDGASDHSFGIEGYLQVTLPPILRRSIRQIEIDPQDGSFFVCTTNSSNRYYAIGKFTPDGVLNSEFGQAGIVSEPTNFAESYTALELLPDGKLLAGGFTSILFNNANMLITRLNPDGSRDTSFGTNGKTIVPIPFNQYVTSFAIQPDGKIIAAGYALEMTYSPSWMCMVRLLPSGQMDVGFGIGGFISGVGGLSSDVLIQQDGKVLLVGGEERGQDPRAWIMQRFMPDGTRDTSFGDMSIVSTPISSYELDKPRALILPDGKLFMYGSVNNRLNLLGYLPNGSVDTTYGDQGGAQTDFGMALGERMLLLLQDNKLLLFGDAGRGDNILGRCLMDGSIDNSFRQNGYIVSDFGGDAIAWDGAKALSDGRLAATIVVGQQLLVKRYLPDGTLDTNFGNNGTAYSNLPPYTRYVGFPRAYPDENDGVVVAITINHSYFSLNRYYIYVVRFRSDGSIDHSFGNNGGVYLSYGSGDSRCTHLSILPDGKILVTGYGSAFAPPISPAIETIALARLHVDGSLDSTFGISGVAYLPPAINSVWSLTSTYYPDSRIVSAGSGFFEMFAPNQMIVARFLPDGQIDQSFGPSPGQVILDANPLSGVVEQLALQSDGKILAAGQNGNTAAVFRLLEDGRIDVDFGNMGAFRFQNGHYPCKIIVLEDSGLLFVNSYSYPSGEAAISFLRLDADGVPVSAFGVNGLFISSPFPDFRVTDAVYLPGNKVVVSGYSAGRFVMARYNLGPSTGIREYDEQEMQLLVWPNPFKETLNIRYTLPRSGRLHIRLFDAYGREMQPPLTNVYRTEGRHQEQLRMSEDLPAGVYFIKVEADRASAHFKILKR
jgi:uncharacterized delta-60 repeat protein